MPEKTITVTQDDADRLGGIAGELENLPREIRRHLDQDGRDARYLRLLEKRSRAALTAHTQPVQGGEPITPHNDREPSLDIDLLRKVLLSTRVIEAAGETPRADDGYTDAEHIIEAALTAALSDLEERNGS